MPLTYFVGTRPGWYRPLYPCYLAEDRPSEQRVLVTVGGIDSTLPVPRPVPLEDDLARRYAARETKMRLHQARSRGLVLPAYRDRCAMCLLKEIRLLDAAHIIRDADPAGGPPSRTG